ncbi:MAG: aminotransferase class V-fold PLP-dependent enzyme [Rhodospirillaceae bacterium]|nr:aminotransferase class V-fold PLP-dependent enzyme [Rhodospirillaceae bacterium]MBT7250982.1 aminotransferase class V-fold PLP-dependent enzyme [Rhodospirillaceae bacterium]
MNTTPTDPDWAALRREFPTTETCVYLNISNKAILPRLVEQSMQSWMRDIYEDAGEGAFAMNGIEETRNAVAETFGAPPENLALIKNTSEGINIVAQGFPWAESDNVVISEFEHENNTFPWRHLGRRGVDVRLAAPGADGRITIDQYRELIDDRTRILAVGWVVYGNGYRADLKELSNFCRERDIKLVVDGIQAVGIINTPLAETGADVLIAGGHKAQFSLAGAGLMYATPEMIELLTPPYAAKFSFTSLDRTLNDPELAHDAHRFEYGNPNFLGCWVQKRSAEYVQSIGLGQIENRVRALTTYLIDAAERRQIKIRTPRPWEQRAGIVSLDLGRDAGPAVKALEKKRIIVSYKDTHLRVSAHFYNNEEDMGRLLDALPEV